MSITGIGNGGGFDPSKMASKIATQMVKQLDSNGDGSIDKSEFVTAMAANGIASDQAAKRFDELDTNKTGKLTQSDIEAGIKAAVGKGGPPSGARPPAGGPPGGARPAGRAPQSGSAAKSTDTKTYDKKDANKDGTVSIQEELVYDIAHPNDVAASSVKSTGLQNIGKNIDVSA